MSETRRFGSPGRINHDSTAFYAARLYEGLPKEHPVPYREYPIPSEYLDRIFCKSSENMAEAIAAVQSNRHYVGYEINRDYTRLAASRIAAVQVDRGFGW